MQKTYSSSKDLNNITSIAEELQQTKIKEEENPFAKRLRSIMDNPNGKVFLIRMLDVVFRTKNYARIAIYIQRLFKSSTSYQKLLSSQEKVLVRLFRLIGYRLPSVSIPIMLRQIQEITSPVVFFLGDQALKDHYNKRKSEGIQLNINVIGEAIVGEQEAKKRIPVSYTHLTLPTTSRV